jgi:hypothetical protein
MSSRNPYASNNGYSNPNPSRRYGDDTYSQDNESSTGSVSAYSSRERRPRGYGGLGADPNDISPRKSSSRTRPQVDEDSEYKSRRARYSPGRDLNGSTRSRDGAGSRTNDQGSASARSTTGRGSLEGQFSELPELSSMNQLMIWRLHTLIFSSLFRCLEIHPIRLAIHG